MRRHFPLGLAIPFCLAAAVTAAQAQLAIPSPATEFGTGTGVIVGQVVDAATGTGVGGAVVTLANARRVLTTSSGQFVFARVPAGTHALTASRTGYLDGFLGARRAGGTATPLILADGERRGDAVIRMWRPAAITGTVVDEAGEPVVGVSVTAWRRVSAGGRRRLNPATTTQTDDRGIYRLSRLVPGDYVVLLPTSSVSIPADTVRKFEDELFRGPATNPLNLARSTMVQTFGQIGATTAMLSPGDRRTIGDQVQAMAHSPTPPPAAGARPAVYPTVYFPSVSSLKSATTITVASGQERGGIDLAVRPVPTVRVSGTVSSPSGSASGLPVQLTAAGADEALRPPDAAGTVTDSAGHFTFAAVPAGDYTLRIIQVPRQSSPGTPLTVQVGSSMTITSTTAADQGPRASEDPTLWATLPLSVGDADLEGVGVVLRTGGRVTGRLELDGAAAKPTSEQLSRIGIVLEPVDGAVSRIAAVPGRIERDGTFKSAGVAGGRYFVRILGAPPGWTLKGAFHGEKDLTDFPFELEADLNDVVLSYTDRPSSLGGTIQMSGNDGRDGVGVVVFPADTRLWAESSAASRRFRRVSARDDGGFEVAAIPPGSYYVAAIRESAGADWIDPAFLESLAGNASIVQIAEGERAIQNLRVQEVR